MTQRVSRNDVDAGTKLMWKLNAWKKHKKVMLTVENPDHKQTNERMIRVDAKSIWGTYGVSSKASKDKKVSHAG